MVFDYIAVFYNPQRSSLGTSARRTTTSEGGDCADSWDQTREVTIRGFVAPDCMAVRSPFFPSLAAVA